MAAIDIGDTAIDRSSTASPGYTRVNKGNPANATGVITSIEIWAFDNLSNCEVATFYVVSGNNLSTRDTHTIGSVIGGSKQTFSGLSIDVEAGDYIGIYYTAGNLEKDSAGGSGFWSLNSDQIPCTNEEFNSSDDFKLSLYGIGISSETHHLAGTSVNIVSTTGAVEVILDLTGTSINAFTTLGSISGTLRLLGTSANAFTTLGVISGTLKLLGTSVNTISTISDILNATLVLQGTSANVVMAIAPELITANVKKLLGTSVNVISTLGSLGGFHHLLGTSANVVSGVSDTLWLNVPWWTEKSKEGASWTEKSKEGASWTEKSKEGASWTEVIRSHS